MDTISFKRHRFPPEIIRRAIWLYARFTLSYRDVEDLLAERGVDISYESVRRWLLKFGAPIAQNLRHMRPIPNGYWHLDEMVIVIRGQRYWLWRAIDNGGEVLDFLVQSKRNAKAALKLMRKLLKKQGWTPTRITTDKLRSYHVAIRTLGLTAQHIDQCCPGKVAPSDGKSRPLNVLWPVLPGNDLKSRGRKWSPERSIRTRHNEG